MLQFSPQIELIFNETPSGLINGANATFTTQYKFVPGKIDVYVNGLKQKIVQDFNTTGNNTIILTFSPASGETITVDYQRY